MRCPQEHCRLGLPAGAGAINFLVRLQTLANFCTGFRGCPHGNAAALREMKASLACILCLAAAAAAAPLDNDSIKTAVAAWLSDSAAAEVTYGHITSWDTSQVTDMSSLFCAHHSLSSCNTAALSFNEDIGTWDTSGVTSMYAMFGSNEGFNRDLSDWAVDSVTDMSYMFSYARSFNQDLGWCVDDGANLDYAFSSTLCESTSCGVTQGGCASWFGSDAAPKTQFTSFGALLGAAALLML